MDNRVSAGEINHAAVGRATSPAFMRLLSHRSPKSPSHSSCSPSVVSQLSSRRRLSSPKIVARAWLGPADSSPLPASSAHKQISNENDTACCMAKESAFQEYSVLNRSHDRSGGTKRRDSLRDPRGRPSSRNSRKGHKKRHDTPTNHRRRQGSEHHPMDDLPRRPSCSPSRRAPRLVISPRRLPPPTFEKILLGLADSDFTVANEDTDVFGGEKQLPRRAHEVQEEEECMADSSEPHGPLSGDQVSTLTPNTSRTAESLLGTRIDVQGDGVIPEHYLYIPPLRLEISREERRPVPGLQQAADDQISVRGDRRHIATLFSLEAAESHAQKSRLQEQLKETTPFRLAEMSNLSSAVDEGLKGPPGKSKRRRRSAVLETIVRQHDWEAHEPALEEETQTHHRQLRSPEESYPGSQTEDNRPETEASDKKMQWDHLAQDGSLQVMSGACSPEEGHGSNYAHGAHKEGHAVLDVGAADIRDAAQYRSQEGSVGDKTADVPRSFDTIWGCYERSRPAISDTTSEAAYSDDEYHKQLFHTDNGSSDRINRIAEFLAVPPVLPEEEEEDDSAGFAALFASDASNSAGGVGNRQEGGPSSSQHLAAGRNLGGVPLLRLKDPAGWEVRYSTAEGFPSSTEQSPVHCVKALSPAAEAKEEEGTSHSVVEVKEEELQGISDRGALEQLCEEPPSTVSCHQEVSGGQSRMISSSSTRLFSAGQCETNSGPSGLPANGLSDATLRVTKEPRLGAALSLPLVSLQSFRGEPTKTRRAIPRCSTTLMSNGRRSAFRKRQRTLQDAGAGATCEAKPVHTDRRILGNWTGGATKSVQDSPARRLAGDAETSSSESWKSGWKQREQELSVASTAEAGLATAATHTEETIHSPEAPPAITSAGSRLQLAEVLYEDDAWQEKGSLSLHDVEMDATDGCQTDCHGNEYMCDIDLSESVKVSDRVSPCRSPWTPSSRSMEVFRAIDRVTSRCAYGPRVHATFVGLTLLTLWTLLAFFYLFDEGRGAHFFAGCAVALAFALSLCLGSIQTIVSLFKWSSLKYAIDSDMQEHLFASLKRLRPGLNARDPSVEGMGEQSKQLRLACNYFVELITQGSPCLAVSSMVERRFIMANLAVGVAGAGLIAVLECSIQNKGKSSPTQYAGDAIATGAAVLYSVLLLVLSYWLATAPSPAFVERAVENHTAFQYLWVLTFSDFLVDKGAVTAKSAEDIRLRQMEDFPKKSSSYLVSLKNSPFNRTKTMSTIRIRGLLISAKCYWMTARIVWQLPRGISPKILKDFRAGQRALLTVKAAPRDADGSESPAAPYLKLIWCSKRAMPVELQLPIGFDSLDCESSVAGGIPFPLRSFVWGQRRPDVGNGVTSQAPVEVMRLLVRLLQRDSTNNFLKSQTRRYLSEPAPLPSASCEFPLILRIPVDFIGRGSCSSCGVRSKDERGAIAFRSMLRHSHLRGGPTVERGDVEMAFPKGTTSHDPVAEAQVGPWTVQSSCIPPRRPVQLHRSSNLRLAASGNAANAESAISEAHSHHEASDDVAVLTLLFASEEQREEFNGYLEEALCS